CTVSVGAPTWCSSTSPTRSSRRTRRPTGAWRRSPAASGITREARTVRVTETAAPAAGRAPAAQQPGGSVGLVNWNCGRFVAGICASLVAQTHPHLEVLVVDNGSVDGSCERFEALCPGARVIRLGANTGFSHALNVGVAQTRGEYVLSLNFDVVLEA